MRFDVITIFPEAFVSYLDQSVFGRAKKGKIIKVFFHNLRDYAADKHKTVDDAPYGGGPGMVLKIAPIYKAIKSLRLKKKKRIILFSTRGRKFDEKSTKRLAKYDQLIFICGRYEGVDERVAKHLADEEISVGDFVLAGGELPAMMVMEAVARFVPGVLGKKESLESVKGSYPTYTRPEEFKSWKVPRVLLSGNHKKIEEWRKQH